MSEWKMPEWMRACARAVGYEINRFLELLNGESDSATCARARLLYFDLERLYKASLLHTPAERDALQQERELLDAEAKRQQYALEYGSTDEVQNKRADELDKERATLQKQLAKSKMVAKELDGELKAAFDREEKLRERVEKLTAGNKRYVEALGTCGAVQKERVRELAQENERLPSRVDLLGWKACLKLIYQDTQEGKTATELATIIEQMGKALDAGGE